MITKWHDILMTSILYIVSTSQKHSAIYELLSTVTEMYLNFSMGFSDILREKPSPCSRTTTIHSGGRTKDHFPGMKNTRTPLNPCQQQITSFKFTTIDYQPTPEQLECIKKVYQKKYTNTIKFH